KGGGMWRLGRVRSSDRSGWHISPACTRLRPAKGREMARKRVLITGITGMVGSHLADFLLEQTDWDIVGMCRWRSPMDNLGHIAHRINAGDRLFLQYGDLR